MGKYFKMIQSVVLLSMALLLAGCASDSESAQDPFNANKSVLENTFKLSLNADYYVQDGTYFEIDTLKLASEGMLTSCFGNNEGSSYQIVFIPPAPGQEAAKVTTMLLPSVKPLGWINQEASQYEDVYGENKFPENPYFAPVGGNFKLREDEVIVLMYQLPNESKYFSLGLYHMMSAAAEGRGILAGKTYDRYELSIPYGDKVGNQTVIFASIGDQFNNYRIKSSATAGGDVYGKIAVVVIGGDSIANESVVDELIASGIDSSIINVKEIPSETYKMGLQKGADTFLILGRISQPADQTEYRNYLDNLETRSQVYRITPKTQEVSEEIQVAKLLRRGTGIHESRLLGYARKDLEKIRQEIIQTHAVGGYTFRELSPPNIFTPDGLTSTYNGANGIGDNRDTAYLSTEDFEFTSDDDFVIVYGVNHTRTGKASYSNAVLYGREKLNGVAGVYDKNYIGSANKYLSNGKHEADSYYVYKFDRSGTDGFSKQVKFSKGNTTGKYYGVDNGSPLFLAFRAYIEPSTTVGPDVTELIYDRAILFTKTP